MSNPAGEPPNRLHLLRLGERIFVAPKLVGAFRNLLFQRRIQLPERIFGAPAFLDLTLGRLAQPGVAMATAASAASAVKPRSDRSMNTPTFAWPNNKPPSTSPDREITGIAR